MPRCATSSTRGRRRWLGNRGAVALEFAMVGSAYLVLLVCTIEVGRYAFTRVSVTAAVGEAKRVAVIDPTMVGCVLPKASIASRISFLHQPDLTLCITRSTAAGITTATISVSYPFHFIVPLLGTAPRTITASGSAKF